MNVTAKNWQRTAGQAAYPAARSQAASKPEKESSAQSAEKTAQAAGNPAKARSRQTSDTDTLTRSLQSLSGKDSDKSDSFKMKSTSPKTSVGELAAMLAKAETRMDVLEVSSKATRALMELKMAAMTNDEKEAKKIKQQIKRMEKLIKRIHKKLRHLSKEEQMVEQQKKAAKKAEEEKVRQIQKELEAHRKKRRREERNYAFKELEKDAKESSSEMLTDMMGGSSSGLSGLSEAGAFEGIDIGSFSAEGFSVDIMA